MTECIDRIHRLYNLRTVEIPIQPTDGNTIFKFVETLLIIRVNVSFSTEGSSTVPSPPNSPKTRKEVLHLQFAETVNKNSWNQCCFSQGGEYVIGGSAKLATHQIFIWDIRTTRLVQTLQGPYENLVDLAQHPIQPIIVSVDEQGAMHTLTTRHKEDWVNWNPAFTEIHDNIFDIVNEEVQSVQYNKNQNFENDEEIDVVTIDRTTRSDSSDYEDEFINLYDSDNSSA
ncbi:35673_t:CDS:2 [Gigaspora margarita]|uniref:35673_t:CDS:1 n=1 Tax=Gigaspora margarita TaxID=4874 RepID=A0ABN7V7R0_GIGMA|nr:35673_t:CDS:2 [Gigaspora margarita]